MPGTVYTESICPLRRLLNALYSSLQGDLMDLAVDWSRDFLGRLEKVSSCRRAHTDAPFCFCIEAFFLQRVSLLEGMAEAYIKETQFKTSTTQRFVGLR